MNIYRKRSQSRIYRKIYEHHYGTIPKDDLGRSYEIHHLDGNPNNNISSNLIAVSVQQHYDIHYSQNDLDACLLIAWRLGKSTDEMSDLATRSLLEKIKNKTHPWTNPEHSKNIQKKRIDNGTHNLLGSNNPGYDSTIYCFVHTITNEECHMTRSEFVKHYSVDSSNVGRMIKGDRKTVKNWKIKIINSSD